MGAVDDVAIVGYGPVGQLAALLLGQRGHRVSVYERRSEPYGLPRAVHVDDEVLRVMQGAGLADEVTAIMDAPITYEWRDARGRTLLTFDLTGLGGHGFPASNMFSQPDLEAALDAAVRALPNVTVHRDAPVAKPRDAGDHVELSVGGRPARARYLVGCDGTGSVVRDALDSTVTDLGFTHDWLVVDVRPNRPRAWDPPALQVCDPARPTTAVPGGPGRRRFEFMLLPTDSRVELERPDTVWALLAPWDVRPDNATLQRHAVYTFRALWADRWRRGRILIAGDAAHQLPPFAGQGLAAGVRDVANLAWKLDLVLTGRAGEAILDTYPSERLPQVTVAATVSVELGKVICVLDPRAAAQRDEGMLAARAAGAQAVQPPPQPGLGEGLAMVGDPLAGQPFPQGRVGPERRRFDDVVVRLAGSGPMLVGLAGLTGMAAGTAGALGSRLGVPVVDLGAIGDPDGYYARWFGEHDRAVVLVRPDRYVFASCPDPAGAADLVGHWNAALSGVGPHPDTGS